MNHIYVLRLRAQKKRNGSHKGASAPFKIRNGPHKGASAPFKICAPGVRPSGDLRRRGARQ
jgi:hypothetical protein